MFSCDVCDGQRSSLIVQLQSVSESPIKKKKIIIYSHSLIIVCVEDSVLNADFSYERLFSHS